MIYQPNYTQCPNVFFDEILQTISGADAKVFCVIMRKTFGWQKVKDRISYSQIMKLSGITSKTTVSKAIKNLETMGYILAERDGQNTVYSVNVPENEPVQKMDQSNNCTGTGPLSGQVKAKTGPLNGHTKERDINKLSKEIYVEIETAYLDAFKVVIPNGEPVLDYGAIRKRQKAVLSKLSKDKILTAIERAKKDKWIIENGFSLMTILGDFQLNKLLNGSNSPRPGQAIKVNERTTFLDMEEK